MDREALDRRLGTVALNVRGLTCVAAGSRVTDGSLISLLLIRLPLNLGVRPQCGGGVPANGMRITGAGLLLVLAAACSSSEHADKPFYGFYPSAQGADWKQLRHNLFEFSIDVPSSWTFGIAGQPPTAVVLLFPESMNAGQITRDYGTVEIGRIEGPQGSLRELADMAIVGIRQKHASLQLDVPPREVRIAGRQAVSFEYTWPSMTGFQIVEQVSLVSDAGRVYSIAVRATREAMRDNGRMYARVSSTFKPSAQAP